MKKVILMCIAVILFGAVDAFAGFIKINGIVKSKGAVAGAIISLRGTEYSTYSDLNGAFTLFVPDSVKEPFYIVVKCSNYKDKSVKITKNKNIQISLTKITVPSNNKKTKGGKEKVTALRKGDKLMKEMSFAAMDVSSRAAVESMSAPDATGVMKPMNDIAAEAGKLTAGELNDFAKWELWSDLTANEFGEYAKEWKMEVNERYVMQVVNSQGYPLLDVRVILKDSQGQNIWEARTDNTGKAELWASMFNDVKNNGAPYSIQIFYKNKNYTINNAKPFAEGINTIAIETECGSQKIVEVCFVVDATGSMGDEISYLQAELYDVIAQVSKNNTDIDLRVGSVFYRDSSDEYITRTSRLDGNIDKTINFIKEQNAAGGGDLPEAVDVALQECNENIGWSEDAIARVAFIILDAPPHKDTVSMQRLQRQIRIAAMKGIRIVPLVCSGADKSTEFLCRSIALATNGSYVFLTDESGIGGSHIKPSTDKYDVEKLNHILMRIINEFSYMNRCNVISDKPIINNADKYIPKPDVEVHTSERLNTNDVFTIYPNPTNGILNIGINKEITIMYVADITGKILARHNDIRSAMQIDLSSYSNGIYFVNAYYNGLWYMQKVVLQQ